MRELAFRIVNVFTQNRGQLTGNPLCVFESAASLDTATMQALARQFNLSETTFILPSSRATAQRADLHAELRNAVRRAIPRSAPPTCAARSASAAMT